jgi:hypothetical protein
MVGQNGIEPSTLPLSGVRSNLLSYWPVRALLIYHSINEMSIYFLVFLIFLFSTNLYNLGGQLAPLNLIYYTNSTKQIGALSPSRLSSFKILV